MERLKKLKQLWLRRPLVSRLWLLGICLLVFTVELQNALSGKASNLQLKLAAKRDLSEGLTITVHDLTVTPTQKGSEGISDSFTDQELHEVIGSRVVTNIPAGSIILKNQLQAKSMMKFSQKVPKGLRAFTIRTRTRLPIEPGDRVDLLSAQTHSGSKSNYLLEDKKVLAVNKLDEYQEILVALSFEDIRYIQSFNSDGWVDLTLRNPMETPSVSVKRPEVKGRKKTKIELLEEG